MKQTLSRFSAILVVLWLAFPPLGAKILSVEQGWSNTDTAPEVISAPIAVLSEMVTNHGMQGFDEAQGVITTVAYKFDGGFIPAGSLVDSHMIFLNSPDNWRSHQNVKWTFDGVIIGVMSDEGIMEHASTSELGNLLTEYPNPTLPFPYRGLERNDGYAFTGNPKELVVSMQDQGYESGDWIRVVTVPPAALEVEIVIKPGGNPNSINCKNHNGVIPIAILTTADFDALTVDHTNVWFEGAEETHIDKKSGLPRRHEEDVDRDGDLDLVFHFRLGDTALTCESVEGTLTGLLWDKTEFTGSAELSVVPARE
jgi:hypothetical protein